MRTIFEEFRAAIFICIVIIFLIVTASPISEIISYSIMDVVGKSSKLGKFDPILTENLALGKKVECSGEQADGTKGSYATDGNIESRWASNFDDDA